MMLSFHENGVLNPKIRKLDFFYTERSVISHAMQYRPDTYTLTLTSLIVNFRFTGIGTQFYC